MDAADSAAIVVAYDISDDRKRRNLHKHLAGYGIPLQESLFYCQLDSARTRRRLCRELNELPLEGDDRLHCFPVNADLAAKLSPSPLHALQWVAE